jgi:hypothetical protein
MIAKTEQQSGEKAIKGQHAAGPDKHDDGNLSK